MPGNSCTLCKSSWDNTISMFALPSDEYLKKEWEAACGIKLTPSSRICAKHFAGKDFVKNNLKRTRLQTDAVPSLNLSIKKKEVDKMLFNTANSYRKNRASLGQLVYFVNFAKKHPKMLTSKFSTVKYLWEELARQLNTLDGASRTPLKWKETMATWRCQLRCRARRGKSSGVPEFDEFALCNFWEQSDEFNEMANNSSGMEFEAQNSNDKSDENNESIEADFAIKTEVDSSDAENSTSFKNLADSCVSEVDPQAEAITGFEEEIDIKPDIDNEAIHEPSDSGSKTKIRTLGFPHSSRSKIFIIPHPTSTENRTVDNTTKTSNLKRKFVSDTSTDNGSSKIAVIANTAGLKKIIEPVATMSTSKSPERGEAPTILNNASQFARNSSPTAQLPETSASECKTTTLNEIYETVLASIRRRDERDEQFTNAIQELTSAVTKMADNVKRLEEVLIFCANN